MRGYLKRRKQRRAVATHLKQHGGFHFHGNSVSVPTNLELSIQSIIADGTYESAECSLVERFLPEDLPVIELGGCLGLVSSVVARKLLPNTKLIVVEANPTLLDTCRHNATIGGTRKSTEVIPKAIAYHAAHVSFDVRDNVHISRLSDDVTATKTMVDATTLRDLVGIIASQAGYVLICDIEGAEIDLLEHDLDALQTCRLIIIELHPERCEARGCTIDTMIDLVRSANFHRLAQEDNVFAFEKRSDALIESL